MVKAAIADAGSISGALTAGGLAGEQNVNHAIWKHVPPEPALEADATPARDARTRAKLIFRNTVKTSG
jgi:hypothetical protein